MVENKIKTHTIITIIRIVSLAGMSVHKIFIFVLPCFVIIAFCQFLTLRSEELIRTHHLLI